MKIKMQKPPQCKFVLKKKTKKTPHNNNNTATTVKNTLLKVISRSLMPKTKGKISLIGLNHSGIL